MIPTSPSALSGSANARMVKVENALQQMLQDQGVHASQVNSRIASIESTIRGSQEAIRVEFDRSAASRAQQIAKVISDAKAEFDNQRQLQQGIVDAVRLELDKLQAQIEQGSSKDSGQKFGKSFIPVKDMKPPKLCKEEQWRDWAELFA